MGLLGQRVDSSGDQVDSLASRLKSYQEQQQLAEAEVKVGASGGGLISCLWRGVISC